MSAATSRISLLTCQAQATSTVSGAEGRVLNYELVTGIKLPTHSRPTMYRPRRYDELVVKGGRRRELTFELETAVVERLVAFVRTCMVRGHTGYDAFDFVSYLLGVNNTPTEHRHNHMSGPATHTAKVTLGRAYVILGQEHEQVHAFVGLGPRLALTVNGINAALAISSVGPLMRAYNGGCLHRIEMLRQGVSH